MSRRSNVILLTLLFIIQTALVLYADDNFEKAILPYRSIYQIYNLTIEAKFDNIRQKITITSRRQNVKPSDIIITIASKKTPHVIRIKEDGTFNFPLTKDLFDENPAVIANQPKGSLSLNFKFEFSEKHKDKHEYPVVLRCFPTIMGILANAAHAVKIAGEEFPDVVGSTLVFSLQGERKPLKVVIKGRDFEESYVADKEGNCKIEISQRHTGDDIFFYVYASKFDFNLYLRKK